MWLNCFRDWMINSTILFSLILGCNFPMFAAGPLDPPASGVSWSLWNDEHGTTWAARAIPMSIGKFESGTVKTYWKLSNYSTASPLTQSELTQLQYRRTGSLEWIIPHHGVIQFRKIGSQSNWRDLLKSNGERVLISHAALIDANSGGLIVEQSSDGRQPYLLAISDPRRGEPETNEWSLAPATVTSMISDNGLTDGTGGHGVLFFDSNFNLLSIAPGDRKPESVFASSRIHRLFLRNKNAKTVGAARSRLDSDTPVILGRTKAGILLKQVFFDDFDEKHSTIMYYRIGNDGNILPLKVSGSIVSYACDGHVLWAVVDNSRVPGSRLFKPDSSATFNLICLGGSSEKSVRLPMIGNNRNFHTLLLKPHNKKQKIIEVSTGVDGNLTDVCQVDLAIDGKLLCSPNVSVSGDLSSLIWCGAVKDDKLLIPMANGGVNTVNISRSSS